MNAQKSKEILDSLSLSVPDAFSLKAHRGFTDETIAKLKFKSCGPYCKDFDSLKDIHHKVYESFTTKDNVVIPFFDQRLDIIKLKPHKYNLPDDELEIYCPWPLIDPNSENVWVLTEGEFKAAASAQLGFNAAAVPGINTFTRKHLSKMIDFFLAVKPKGIIIAFDNEYKDKPEYDRYKKDYTKRYDSQLYAYVNAKLLEKEFPNVLICTLPIDQHIDGKTDIDGLLSKGMTRTQFGLILSQSVTANEYRKSWKSLPAAHLSFLERKIDKMFYTGPIKEQFNRYYLKKGAETEDENGKSKQKLNEISNFTIKIINTVRGDKEGSGEVQRLVKLKSNYGESEPFILNADVMASKSAFTKLIISKGDFTFMGPENIIPELWRYLFMSQSGLIIRKIDVFGHDPNNDMWIFANGIYKDDEFFPSDNNGISSVRDDYFKICEVEENDLPNPLLEQEKPNYTIEDLFTKFKNISDEYFARMFFGWIFGNLFCDKIKAKYGSFPFIYFDGPHGSGKSTLAGFMMDFFGMLNSKGVPLQGSTKVGMRNLSTRYSNIPIHFEESRQGDDGTVITNSLFRNLYDRSSMIKGSKKDGQIITKTPTANVIVSGEEAPVDAATASRFIILSVSKYAHKRAQNKESFDWIQNNKASFSYFVHSALLHKSELWSKIEYCIDEYIEGFKDFHDLSTRNKIHNSIIAGVSDAVVGISDKFTSLVALKAKTSEGRIKAVQATDVFWEDISSLVKEKVIKGDYHVLEDENGVIIAKVAYNTLYTLWEKHFKNLRKSLPISREAILTNMRTEPYFYDSRRVRIGTERPVGIIVRFGDDLPEGLLTMILIKEKEGGEGITSLAQDLISKYDKQLTKEK